MSDDNQHIVDEHLMAKFFSEETSTEENKQIEAWRLASAANQRQFDTWRLVWADTGRLVVFDSQPTLDVEKALNRVRKRKDELRAAQPQRPAVLQWAWRIAAMLVVGVGLGWFLWSSQATDTLELVAEAETTVSQLPDGTVISLNVGSSVTVASLNDETREVFLQGEAFFEVAPDPERPFVVRTEEVEVEVLGTAFNVTQTDDAQTRVSVEEGRVRFRGGQQELILTAGQTGLYNHGTTELQLLNVDDTGEFRFWKTKRLVFREQTLAEVVATLSRTYDQELSLANPDIGQCQLTVTFEEETLENILEVISITLGLEIIETEDGLVIDGEGC